MATKSAKLHQHRLAALDRSRPVTAHVWRMQDELVQALGNRTLGIKSLQDLRTEAPALRQLINTFYEKIDAHVQASLLSHVVAESQAVQDLFGGKLTRGLTAHQLEGAALQLTLDKATLPQWWKQQAHNLSQRTLGLLQEGLKSKEIPAQLRERIVGQGAARGFRNGVRVLAQHQARTLIETATSSMSSIVENELYKRNKVQELEWDATLDDSTTDFCWKRDGKRYTVGHRPIGHTLSWGAGPGRAHWFCRSVAVPIF